MGRVTINGMPTLRSESYAWEFRTGVEPVSQQFTLLGRHADQLGRDITLVFESEPGTISGQQTFSGLVRGDILPEAEKIDKSLHIKRVQILDARWWLTFGGCAGQFNTPKRDFKANRIGVLDEFFFWEQTLKRDGKGGYSIYSLQEMIEQVFSSWDGGGGGATESSGEYNEKTGLNEGSESSSTSSLLQGRVNISVPEIYPQDVRYEGTPAECLRILLENPAVKPYVIMYATPDGMIHITKRPAPVSSITVPGVIGGNVGNVISDTKRPQEAHLIHPIQRRMLVNNWISVIPADETIPVIMAGTAGTTAGSKTVSGTDTTFLDEVSAGQMIRIGSQTREVAKVNSNTELELTENATNTALAKGRVVAVVGGVEQNWQVGDWIEAGKLLDYWGYSLDLARVEFPIVSWQFPSLMPNIDNTTQKQLARVRNLRVSLLQQHLWRSFRPYGSVPVIGSSPLGGGWPGAFVANKERKIEAWGDWYQENRTGYGYQNITMGVITGLLDTVAWNSTGRVEHTATLIDPDNRIVQLGGPAWLRYQHHIETYDPASDVAAVEDINLCILEFQGTDRLVVAIFADLIPTSVPDDYYSQNVKTGIDGVSGTKKYYFSKIPAMFDDASSQTVPVNQTELEAELEVYKQKVEYEFQNIYTGSLRYNGIKSVEGMHSGPVGQIDNVIWQVTGGVSSTAITWFDRRVDTPVARQASELHALKRAVEIQGRIHV